MIFKWICNLYHCPEVDLFATRFNTQLPGFVSPIPDQEAWEYNTLAISWESLNAYAFPCLSTSSASEDHSHDAVTSALVAPYWPARSWLTVLVNLRKGRHHPLPFQRYLLLQPHSSLLQPLPETLHLCVWFISRCP